MYCKREYDCMFSVCVVFKVVAKLLLIDCFRNPEWRQLLVEMWFTANRCLGMNKKVC